MGTVASEKQGTYFKAQDAMDKQLWSVKKI